ncbi:hypothetical protein T4D_3881 [Trichinella pseudospiralis]|uniref:Uncharacterized protein n=1 Tax=Trichinella pseudospiralis TaxID=6337 RepID=A0A0V1F5L0_TRIPS|nr:hypothetical protein T4D_3881 [Trichinella pseudospiralis]
MFACCKSNPGAAQSMTRGLHTICDEILSDSTVDLTSHWKRKGFFESLPRERPEIEELWTQDVLNVQKHISLRKHFFSTKCIQSKYRCSLKDKSHSNFLQLATTSIEVEIATQVKESELSQSSY